MTERINSTQLEPVSRPESPSQTAAENEEGPKLLGSLPGVTEPIKNLKKQFTVE